MKSVKWVYGGISVILAFGLIITPGCAKNETEEQAEQAAQAVQTRTQEGVEAGLVEPDFELPDAVLAVVEEIFPGAEIYFIEQAEQFGVVLYDIEIKGGQGEIEVTEDGTVIDVVTVITMEELPEAAAQAIRNAAEEITIKRLEKSEIRSEVRVRNEQGIIVKFEAPKYVYEAEIEKDGRTGEITVDASGNIIEPLKWITY